MSKKIRIGIDVGGTNIEACAFYDGVCGTDDVRYVHRAYPKGAHTDELSQVLADCVHELLQSYMCGIADVCNIGVAMPGALDIMHGRVIHAYNLGLDDAPVCDALKSLLGMGDIHLVNDADAATLGELKMGALCGVRSGCMITLGTGVGAGIIINGELYRGGQMRGTELGHMTLDMHGKRCTCGNYGCIETLCSATYLACAAKEVFHDDDMTAKKVTDLARSGEKRAVAVFDRYTDNLSSAIATYMTLLDPERVVLGGGVSLAGEFLFEPVRKKTEKKCFFSPICDIVPAMLGDKAGAIGAAFV